MLLMLLLGTAYFLFIIFAPALQGSPFTTRVGDRLQIMDFVTWYQAGVMAVSSDRTLIYDPSAQLTWLNRIIAPEHSLVPFYIAYPPFFFSLMTPLSLVSLKVAYLLWITIWPIVALAALDQIMKLYAQQFSRIDRALVLTSVLISQPSIVSLRLGQTSWWLLLCLCLLFHGIAANKDRIAGAAIAFSTIKPQYIVFLALPPLILKRWPLLVAAAVMESALLLMTACNVGWQNIIKYPSWLAYVETSEATSSSIAAQSMVNFRGLASSFLPSSFCTVLMLVALIAALIWLIRVWRIGSSISNFRWPMALTLSAASVVSPHLHDHDLVFLSLAAALTLPFISITKAAKLEDWSLSAWSLLLMYYPFLTWLCLMARGYTTVPVLAILNLLLFISAIVHFERSIAPAAPARTC